MNTQNDVYQKQETRSRRFWVLFVLGFFAIDFTIAIVAISMAAGDPSFRSIPGFSERSVHWNERQSAQWRLQEYGWNLVCDMNQSSDTKLAVRIVDKVGKPVRDLKLKLTVFHFTRVAEQQSTECTEELPGLYCGELQIGKAGLWNVDIDGTTSSGERIWTQETIFRDN